MHEVDACAAATRAREPHGGRGSRRPPFLAWASRPGGPLRWWTGGRVLVLACLVAAAPLAWAHPDAMLVDGRLTIEAGGSAVFPASVHFHRLVARYDVVAPDAANLRMEIAPYAEGAPAVAIAPLDGTGRLHHLIDCCLDMDFSGYDVIVRNDGPTPATLDLRAWVVHDDFAVVARAAEVGALEVPLALFLALGVAALVVAGRARRQGLGSGGPARTGRRALLWSRSLFGAAVAVALALAAAGMWRYGAGPIEGLVAIMADVPVPGGLFGSRMAFAMGLLLLAWVAAVGAWIVAVARGAHHAAPRAITGLGLALATVHVGGGLALGWTYDAYAVPVALGLALTLPLTASVAMLRPASPVARRAHHATQL